MNNENKNYIVNIIQGVLIVSAIVVMLFAFVINKEAGVKAFGIKEFENIPVTDLEGSEIKLVDLVSKDENTYIFIFRLLDCPSCVKQGIQDLRSLVKAGKSGLVLVVYDSMDEVEEIAAQYNLSLFFLLGKKDFFEYVHTPVMPVLIKIKNNKLQSHRYIRP